jgi:hypothetical protein
MVVCCWRSLKRKKLPGPEKQNAQVEFFDRRFILLLMHIKLLLNIGISQMVAMLNLKRFQGDQFQSMQREILRVVSKRRSRNQPAFYRGVDE